MHWMQGNEDDWRSGAPKGGERFPSSAWAPVAADAWRHPGA